MNLKTTLFQLYIIVCDINNNMENINQYKNEHIILDSGPFIYYILRSYLETTKKSKHAKEQAWKNYTITPNNLKYFDLKDKIDYLSFKNCKFYIPTYVLVETVNKIKNSLPKKDTESYDKYLQVIPIILAQNNFKEIVVKDSRLFMKDSFHYLGLTDNFIIINSNEYNYPVITTDKLLYEKLDTNSIFLV